MPAAIVLRQFGLGNLRAETQLPEPIGDGLARVAIRALSLNHRDLLVMRGTYGPGLQLPLIPLSDAAGIVTEIGHGVGALRPGDRVVAHADPDWQEGPLLPAMRQTTLGGPAQGMLCEERVLPVGALLRLPDTIGFEAAACLPVAGLAAWSALKSEARIGPGGQILLQGSGGLATIGLAIAKALGARIAAISSTAEKRARLQQIGADFVADRGDPGWSAQVREWSGGGVDAVLDVGGAANLDDPIRAVRDGGIIFLLGVMGHRLRPVDFAEIVMRRIRLQGIFLGSRAEFAAFLDFVATHRISPAIDHVCDGIGLARQAIAEFAAGRHFGKVVIRL